MRRTVGITLGAAAAVALVFVAASCGKDSTGLGSPTYTAVLSPANEVPAKTSTGTGTVTFVDLGTEIDWTMELANISAVTMSHIHGPAAAGANASVIINLFMPNGTSGTLNGTVAQGTITNANNAAVSVDSVRKLMNAGLAYANVHTTTNPGGEIRGQIVKNP
jgi:hypothetical protein